MGNFTDQYNEIFENKNKVMVVLSHPDDAEIYVGGTIARLLKDGKEVSVIKMTYGNKGSRQEEISEEELKKIREIENNNAMQTFGIKPENNVFIEIGDGEVENNLETIGLLVKQIRRFKPDLIITHNPEHKIIRFKKNENWINHRDHLNTGLVTLDAAYPYARDILFFPKQLEEGGIGSHTVKEFLLVDYYDHPDVVTIDISETAEIKNKAIAAHSSQYTEEHAKELTDFFSSFDDSGAKWERFRYVIAD